jgi:hypothetical protein
LFVDRKFLMHCYKNLHQYRRSAGIAGMALPRRRCLILSVEDRDDVATTRFSASNRTVADAASPLRLARIGPRSLTMQSTRYTAAVTVLALLTATALGLLADRNVGTAVVLAGLAAVLHPPRRCRRAIGESPEGARRGDRTRTSGH